VLIQARLVDITTTDLVNLGLKVTSSFSQAGFLDKGSLSKESVSGTLNLSGPSSALTNDELSVTVTGESLSVQPTIDMLLRTNRANLLASPSIATISGKPARVVIGEKVPFKEITQTITGTIETVKFLDVGTTLIVTPWVHDDDNVTLTIHPEVSSLTEFVDDTLPRVATREADTTVTVRNDQTVVIAGLIKTEDEETRSKLPFFGDLPLIGALFQNRSVDQTQTELVIFITPHIIGPTDVLQAVHDEAGAASDLMQQRRADIAVTELWIRANGLIDGAGVFAGQKEREIQVSQAADALEEIVQRYPAHPKAPEALMRLAALYYYQMDDPARAEARLAELLERHPDSEYAGTARRLLRRSRDRGTERQREAARQAYRVAVEALRAGDHALAVTMVQQALRDDPGHRKALALARQLRAAGPMPTAPE
jgi:hypothetical protein